MSNAALAEPSGQPAALLSRCARLLVIMPGYSAPGDRDAFTDGSLLGNTLVQYLRLVRSTATRRHVRLYRDYYANPRNAAYMAERVGEVVEHGQAQHRALLLGPASDVVAPSWATKCTSMELSWVQNPQPLSELARDHDAVLLVHADALGLGLGAVERVLSKACVDRVFVLNGRRRLYRLDAHAQRLLRCRRVLAETRIVEAVLGWLVPIVGKLLAFLDRLSSSKAT